MKRQRNAVSWSVQRSRARRLGWVAAIVAPFGAWSCRAGDASLPDGTKIAGGSNGAVQSTPARVRPTLSPRDGSDVGCPSNPGTGVYVLDWERDKDDPTVAKSPACWNHEYQEELKPKRVRFALKGQADDQVRLGTRAVRFEIKRGDQNDRKVWRAELAAQPPEPPPAARWYGFSIFLPTNWVNDSNGIIVTQWHQQDSDADRFQGTPPLAIMTKAGKWCINTRKAWDNTVSAEADVRPLHTADSPDGSYAPDLGRWTDWVVYVKWSAGADGEMKVWKNGQPLLLDDRARGQNKFDDGKSNYFKIGLYKWSWPDTEAQRPDRVMYHDELRIAAGATDHYKNVVSSGRR